MQTLSRSSPGQEANNRRLKERVTRSLSNLRLRPSARVTVAPAAAVGIDELSTGETAVSTGDVRQAATASQSLSNSTGSDVDMCHVFTTTARSHSMLALNTDTSWPTLQPASQPIPTYITYRRLNARTCSFSHRSKHCYCLFCCYY